MRLKLAVLAVLGAAACQGSNVILATTGLPDTFQNGNYGSSGATYNGFVTATIDGMVNQWILCDDFGHDTKVPSGNMVFDFSTVGGSKPLQNVRFTTGPMVQNYQEAAVLVWQLYQYATSNGAQASGDRITDFQYAIWNIFDPYNPSTNRSGVRVNSNQAALQAQAINLLSTQSAMLAADVFPSVRVYTPDPHGGAASNQEFLQFATPEPGTILLMVGAGLVLMAIHRRKSYAKSRRD